MEGQAAAAEPAIPSGAGALLASATAGLSVVAAAAPALCAVHCAAMPVVAVALPSLQLGGAAGGVCMHSVARKVALYFVVPLGLLANAVSYPQHQSVPTTSASLLGVTCVTAAAVATRLAPHRNVLNGVGCVLMLGASYHQRQLEQEVAAETGVPGCCASCDSGCAA